jgi:hypothetical protein
MESACSTRIANETSLNGFCKNFLDLHQNCLFQRKLTHFYLSLSILAEISQTLYELHV